MKNRSLPFLISLAFPLVPCIARAEPSKKIDASPAKPSIAKSPANTVPTPTPIKVGEVDIDAVDTSTADKLLAFTAQARSAADKEGVVIVFDKKSVLWQASEGTKYVIVDLMPDLAEYVAANGKPKVSPEEQVASKTALKLLKKMASVVKAGVTKTNYIERVGDLKADVDEQLDELPDGDAKVGLASVLQAYMDASSWWDTAGRWDYASILVGDSDMKAIIAKYNLQIDTPGRFEKVYDSEVTSAKYVSIPLSQIWSWANSKIGEVEPLVSQHR